MSDVTQRKYQNAQDKENREAVLVAVIARVDSYNPTKMTVDVTPLSMHLENGKYQSQPPILGVPCSTFSGGGFIVRPFYKKGDIGYVTFCDHDIDRVLMGGKECEPNTERNHSNSDALGFIGIRPFNLPVTGLPEGAFVIAAEGGTPCLAVTKDNVRVIGDLDVSGTLTAGGVNVNRHTHTDSMGGQTTGPQ